MFNTLEGRRGRVRIKVGVVAVAKAEEGSSDPPDASLPSGPTMVAVMTLVSEGLPWSSALPPVVDSDCPHTLAFAEVGMGPKPSPYWTMMVSSTTPGPQRADSPLPLTDSVAR